MKDFMYILRLTPSIPAIFKHFFYLENCRKENAGTGTLNTGETLALSGLKALAHLKSQAMHGGSGCMAESAGDTIQGPTRPLPTLK